jgi:uncharacterized membrane protein
MRHAMWPTRHARGERRMEWVGLIRRGMLPCLLGLAVAAALASSPQVALASEGSYSIDRVDIDAIIASDGSAEVTERRTFSFDGSFHGVYWKVPLGEGMPTEIESAGVVGADGETQEFTQSEDGGEGTYSVSEEDDCWAVKLFSAHDGGTATFEIRYRDQDLATRWSDTGEAYWKFVSDGWDVESHNVTCTIKLPKGGGAGRIRAWGHGPLTGSVSIDQDAGTVTYTAPSVGTSEFAEARIAFPAEWLAGESAREQGRLQDILSEERRWAGETNSLRPKFVLGVVLWAFALCLIPVVLAALAVHQASQSKREKAMLGGRYWRDVPSKDHPAIIECLYDGGRPTARGFSASVLRLCDMGVATVERGHGSEGCGRSALADVLGDRGATITVNVSKSALRGRRGADAIDTLTQWTLCRLPIWYGCAFTRDGDCVTYDLLELRLRMGSRAGEGPMETWNRVVQLSYEKLSGYPARRQTPSTWILRHAKGILLCGFAAMMIGTFVGLPQAPRPVQDGSAWVFVATVAYFFLLAIASVGPIAKAQSLTEKGLEVHARTMGLRRWLKDFTRLEEAVPQDVTLWNELLVMAVALGVAKEAMRQLRVVAPEMVESEGMAPAVMWVGDDFTPGVGDGFESIGGGPSGGSGDGGGFTSGGGGGTGGGGGGGAF